MNSFLGKCSSYHSEVKSGSLIYTFLGTNPLGQRPNILVPLELHPQGGIFFVAHAGGSNPAGP